MPIRFRTDKGILFVTITGKLSVDDVLEVLSETARVVNDQTVRRVLGDVRSADVDVSTNDVFRCTVSLADMFPNHVKYALVFSPETFRIEEATFAEDVAVNRGVLLKMFTELSEAHDWLLAEETPP
jgi:hypothetical protein